jgi:uncharacterized protein YegP (UPF0339 family)
MKAKFELMQSKDGMYHFNLNSLNGQVLFNSQMYELKQSAENGIYAVINAAILQDRFKLRISKSGKFYFNIITNNGQEIAQSQMYETEYNRENGILSVMKNAPNAEIKDLT